ncbi:MAG: DHHA1 domain-containing protein [Candidatus Woesearchaeota archaeon]|nr:DHHA1 domain-containing protein [Candidatus Woesearchaeota archaeon]
MLEQSSILRIREELDSSKRPIFFFHDDADGLCSFLLFYRHVQAGKGVIVKMTPKIDRSFTRKVTEYGPDKVFILDIAMVEQDFLDDMEGLGLKVVWVDHHNPLKREKVTYCNPRILNPKDDTCVTRLCYDVIKKDIWIAMVGSIGDWQMPDFSHAFAKKYPDLFDPKVTRPEEALFSQKIGQLVQIFSFVLKGKTDDVVRCMKILTRITSPYEIMLQQTPSGSFIYKRYMGIKEHYDKLIKRAKSHVTKDDIFIYQYEGEKYSFSSELSNELLYNYPTKVILVGRNKSGEIKYSMRASHKNLPPILERALQGVEGFGGGHEHACGIVIKESSNDRFIDQLKKAL